MENYKLIRDYNQLNSFIEKLPSLKENESYFLILIARAKWDKSIGLPSATKLKRDSVNDKNKIVNIIKQWECEYGSYTAINKSISNDRIIIPNENLGVYIGYNPKNQLNACYELIKQALIKIQKNEKNINIKSMANDVIQGSNGSKNFIDIDVDIKEGENYLEIIDFICQHVDKNNCTFVKTNGGFHCLIDMNKMRDINDKGKWYQSLKKHNYKSDLNIMSNDLMPIPGCNQGKFVPYIMDIK